MPCNLNTICYIDQHNEMAEKSKFIANVIGIINTDLERFKKGDIIQIQGRFL
ncbi:3126_t:CDS:2, partial [Funneliformis geosporum]